MDADFNPDERLAIEAFAVVQRSIGVVDAGPEAPVAAAPVRDAIRRLGTDGWLGVARPADALTQPFHVMAGIAEQLGRASAPLPVALAEMWTAIRILDDLGADEAVLDDITSAQRQVGLAGQLLWGPTPSGRSGAIPMAHAFDAVLAIVGADSSERRVVLSPTADLELRELAHIDLWLPAWSCEAAGFDGGVTVGRMTPAQLDRRRAEYLVLHAAEILGAGSAMLDATKRYLGQREQFGRRLSSMQALRHRVADHVSTLETIRSLVYYAAWRVGAGGGALEELGWLAKGYAGEATWRIASDAVQMHGALGFTEEGGLHRGLSRIAVRASSARSARRCTIDAGLAAIARGELLPL